ncbi:MAG: 50S ribosomal protein L16 [Candidatus Taylorbacteria bacterium RIFCSPLOWO2_01_FULL_44_26]|uniref:Large ribosomal subunit protein uL16 n=2 Tax=Candidatus Tayloriibacteriota TaxID=1817919 RepID=A0A1G2MMX5_9BACT|nr:MAG: 50S ribosomal protein L16 [Candidatus Taylorbacteria bacterium RIFCSPHIGHO2_02_FULL_44_12]OHA31217.1 MAG: 50S ribosomal protein L16 [Candidatus Taylorbacteria bacterium RIFCSPLOWO2_01_FULL_44_26]
MLFPKKVKHRKWFTKRKHPEKEASKNETRGVTLAFGSYGLKAIKYGRLTSNQIEAARKVMVRYATKSGKVWTRVFPDHPYTQKPAEVKMGKGKGDPIGFTAEIKPGRIMFEIDGVDEVVAAEALRKAGTKLPVKTKVVGRV